MSKSNEVAKEEKSNNDDLPMAIQIFLWRQTRCQCYKNDFTPIFELVGMDGGF